MMKTYKENLSLQKLIRTSNLLFALLKSEIFERDNARKYFRDNQIICLTFHYLGFYKRLDQRAMRQYIFGRYGQCLFMRIPQFHRLCVVQRL